MSQTLYVYDNATQRADIVRPGGDGNAERDDTLRTAAMLSIMTGAPLMAVSTWHVDGATHAHITPPISVPGAHTRAQHARDLTQRLADEFAVGISQHPADWHMMQKLWHDDLDS